MQGELRRQFEAFQTLSTRLKLFHKKRQVTRLADSGSRLQTEG